MIPPHLQQDIVAGIKTKNFDMYEMINDVQRCVSFFVFK
jgi:hypothetical protein